MDDRTVNAWILVFSLKTFVLYYTELCGCVMTQFSQSQVGQTVAGSCVKSVQSGTLSHTLQKAYAL